MTQVPSAPTSNANDESIPGERTIPSVNRVRSLQSRMSSVMAIALMGALGLGLLTWYYANALKRPAAAQQSARAASQSKAQGEMPLPSLGKIEQPVSPPAQTPAETADSSIQGSADPAAPISSPPPSSATSVSAPTEKTPRQIALERRLSGVPFAAQATTGQIHSPNASPYIYTAQQPGLPNDPANSDEGGDLSALLQPTVTEAASAQLLPTQQLLLPRGAFVDCTLETAIDSTLPGMTTCITATDTFGADGQVVLMERGTKLIGETRGEVQQGMARIFVLWTEARTPTGVVVPLDSPGTDELGRSGLPGKVNRHFWQRFGAAILISIIEGQGDETVIYDASGSLATEALKSTVNIPPTIVKPQGDRIQILVARDLDFRSVYALRTHQ